MASDTPETASATTPTSGGDFSNGKNSNTAAVHPQRRRIIKAASPKVEDPAVTNGVMQSSKNNKNKDDDDDDVLEGSSRGKHKKQHDPNPIIVEDAREIVDNWRDERLKASQNRGKALREKDLAERRKMNSNKTADASANPFSKFLSAFSVQPKYPEHKRSFEGDPADDDLKGPSEKRRKSCDLNDPEDSTTGGSSRGSSSGIFSSRWFWVSTAAAIAVGVAMALKRGRSK